MKLSAWLEEYYKNDHRVHYDHVVAARELESEVERLRDEVRYLEKEVRREWLSGYEECGRQLDAYRVAVAEVRAYAECTIEDREHSTGILAILDRLPK